MSYRLYDDSRLTMKTSLSVSEKVTTSCKWVNIKCNWRMHSYEDTLKSQNCQTLISNLTELEKVRSWTVNYYKWMIMSCKWVNIKCDWRMHSYEGTLKSQNCQTLTSNLTELKEVRSWTVSCYEWMITNHYWRVSIYI